jgi:LysM repeat protein
MRKLLIGIVLMGALLGLGATRVAATQQGPPKPVWSHVVRPGETLWELAKDASPTGDTRRTVDTLISTNKLHGGRIVPGQTLVLYRR